MELSGKHVLGQMKGAPLSVIRQITAGSVKALFMRRKHTKEEFEANLEYMSLMYTRLSAVDLV